MRRALPFRPHRAAGYTLVELMVTLVLTLLLLAAGFSFYMMSRSSYATIDDNANLQERGNFAMSVVTRLLRQTAFTPPSKDEQGSGGLMVVQDPMLSGLDRCAAPTVAPDANELEQLTCGQGAAINNSDAVMIRFFGNSDDTNKPDGSTIDCSGQAVAGYTDQGQAARQRGLAVLYVGAGASGKPALKCRYRPRDAAGQELLDDPLADEELVPGVESFQLLYGVTVNGDMVPDKYVAAAAMNATDWKNVVTVKVAMVIRADNASADAAGPGSFSLFGTLGANVADATFQPAQDLKSARKLFTATVQLHNYLSCFEGDPACYF
ncbi:PilW family protein [Cupriavidus agavae]|uniref:Type IV pilus assembly protein PilW n=1 Tax=Cupriavidus agavae TaxID=1001822 RepID=A0A4Q7S4N7_9BURK|nr:PilW family protein [Cupriavidus agavae]RZT41396.1 type IV pilus assembly protein PilW [Cupriavidus agavae]